MAIVKTYDWLNDDGLPIAFGVNEAKRGAVAGYRTDGPERCIEVVIYDASAFNATDEYLLSDKVCLPKGAVVTRVQVDAAKKAFASSGGGTISIGQVDDDFASNNDIDAFLALASVTEMNGGGTGNSGSAKASPGDGAGVLTTPLTKRVFLTLSVDTAVYQAGAGAVRIFFEIPKGDDGDSLVYTKP